MMSNSRFSFIYTFVYVSICDTYMNENRKIVFQFASYELLFNNVTLKIHIFQYNT